MDPGAMVFDDAQHTLTRLLGNLPGMVYRCHPDLERTLTFVSMGCLALTGYQPAELHTSGTMAYQRLVHPD
ncbi:MAG: hypothetical protein HGA45_37580, partial [Chloroflexales bacterium]|nr:hypothetical protein [Chloroflexales bacterium]